MSGPPSLPWPNPSRVPGASPTHLHQETGAVQRAADFLRLNPHAATVLCPVPYCAHDVAYGALSDVSMLIVLRHWLAGNLNYWIPDVVLEMGFLEI